MIDKAEQRRRAAEMSQTLASQGLQAPKLTYPVKPKPVVKPAVANWLDQLKVDVQKSKTAKYDCAGKELNIGDKVATSVDGIVSILTVGRILRFTKDRVEIEIPIPVPPHNHGQLQTFRTILKYPGAVAKI